ncbi:hypothetical protein [Sediminibacterium sp.]|uniref:hypothetical protein n=1 Tax=Sediminibacterium sp. TaxID=1917865 RepID=UPI0025DA2BD6|nr:hypothetical protein [Sediminibacterium sp.]
MTTEQLINLTSLVVALVSLVVSIVALRISQKVVVYTSREFLPDIAWNIDSNERLHLNNKSKKLFTIQQVAFLKIESIGFERRDKVGYVQVPFIVLSLMRGDWKGISKFTMNSHNAFACAYVCPYDSNMLDAIREKIKVSPEADSLIRYLPSLQSVYYLIEIIYTNRFNETKSLYLKKQHIHGSGYHDSVITVEEFETLLKRSDIPSFDNANQLWNYILENHHYVYNVQPPTEV